MVSPLPSHRIPNYIGVTGVQAPEQVESLVAAAARHQIGQGFSHNTMLGCLVSPGLVTDGTPTHTTKPYRHVINQSVLVEILSAAQDKGSIGMLHFELTKTGPGEPADVAAVLSLLRALSQSNLFPPVQLNGVFRADDVNEIHKGTPVPLVLQMRKELSDRGETEILRYMESVASSISMILMDPSAGSGLKIDIEPARNLQRAIEKRFPGMFTFGYAGGLGGGSESQIAHTSSVVHSLKKAFGNTHFSIDTETKVRVPSQQPDTDELDMNLCDLYFSAVRKGLTGV